VPLSARPLFSFFMHLQDILYTQGFGTRRVCAGLVQQGHVTIEGQAVTDPFADLDPVWGKGTPSSGSKSSI